MTQPSDLAAPPSRSSESERAAPVISHPTANNPTLPLTPSPALSNRSDCPWTSPLPVELSGSVADQGRTMGSAADLAKLTPTADNLDSTAAAQSTFCPVSASWPVDIDGPAAALVRAESLTPPAVDPASVVPAPADSACVAPSVANLASTAVPAADLASVPKLPLNTKKGRIIALCHLDGEFCTLSSGTKVYFSREAHMIAIDHHILYGDLKSEITSMFNTEVSSMVIMYLRPDNMPAFMTISCDRDLNWVLSLNAGSRVVNIVIQKEPDHMSLIPALLPSIMKTTTDNQNARQLKRHIVGTDNDRSKSKACFTTSAALGINKITDEDDNTLSGIVALCQFGGEFCTLANGSMVYYGGKNHRMEIPQHILYDDLKSKVTSELNIKVDAMAIKYYLADTYQAFMVVTCDRDLNDMISFNSSLGTINVVIINRPDPRFTLSHSCISSKLTGTENQNDGWRKWPNANMGDNRIKVLCQFDGEFCTLSSGSKVYCAGEAHLIEIDQPILYEDLKSKLTSMFHIDIGSMAIKYINLDKRHLFMTVSCDKDLVHVIALNAPLGWMVSIVLQRGLPKPDYSLLAHRRSMMTSTGNQNVDWKKGLASDASKDRRKSCLKNLVAPEIRTLPDADGNSRSRIIALCQFGGKFYTFDGSVVYYGGNFHAMDIDQNVRYDDLKSEITSILNIDVTAMAMKYLRPNTRWAFTKVSCDRDLNHAIAANASSGMVNIVILNKDDNMFG